MSGSRRLGFQFPHERAGSREELLRIAQAAEELGFDSIFVPESWYRETFTTLGWLAASTRRIQLGPGVANVFSRTPSLIAQAIATLDEISGGRAFLGLGTSGPAVIENWHGVRFERALQRTRETVEIVRLALSGKRVDHDGEVFKLSNFKLGFRPPRSAIPILIASLGPKNNALTGEIADGWMPIWLPARGFSSALAEVSATRPSDRAPLRVAPYVMCCTDPDVDRARDAVRPHLAYYVGGMGTFYSSVVSRFGLETEARRLQELWQSGRRKEAVASVSDAMVDELCVVGDRTRCREQLNRYWEAGATMPVVVTPHGLAVDAVVATLEALA